MSVWQIIGSGVRDARTEAIEGRERLIAYGLFVHWLTVLPAKRERFGKLFAQVMAGRPITGEWLGTLIPNVGDAVGLDEAWDRWLMSQKHVVFTLGTVSTRTIEQLRAELLLYSGACGIPLGVEMSRGAELAELIRLRQQDWISQFVREKRSRLDLLGVGRAKAFQLLVVQLGDFLSGLESDMPDTLLLERLSTIRAAIEDLAEQVLAAGGILVE